MRGTIPCQVTSKEMTACSVGSRRQCTRPQRLDDLVVQRTHRQMIWIEAEAAAPPHGTLFGAPGHAPSAVEDSPVGVLADSEHHLERPVPGVSCRPDLLGPRRVGLADGGEGVDDLMSEQFIGSNERARLDTHTTAPRLSQRPPASDPDTILLATDPCRHFTFWH